MKRILILFILIGIKSFSYFEVAPPVQTIDLNRSRTSEVYVINESDKLVRVKIYSQRPEDQKNEELYLGDWMIIYPQLLYLKPKSKRSVRFGMRIPGELEDGEYRSEIVFEELSNEEVTTENPGEVKEETVSLGVLTQIISTIYGNSGEVKREVELLNFEVRNTDEGKVIEGVIVNKGTGAISPIVTINYLDGKGKELKQEEEPRHKIMRENQNEYSYALKDIPPKTEKLMIELFHTEEVEGEEQRIKLGEAKVQI